MYSCKSKTQYELLNWFAGGVWRRGELVVVVRQNRVNTRIEVAFDRGRSSSHGPTPRAHTHTSPRILNISVLYCSRSYLNDSQPCVTQYEPYNVRRKRCIASRSCISKTRKDKNSYLYWQYACLSENGLIQSSGKSSRMLSEFHDGLIWGPKWG